MHEITLKIVESALMADPSVPAEGRNQMLEYLRHGPPAGAAEPVAERLLRRGEVARRLACCTKHVDNLAAENLLRKVRLPGRKRSFGIPESDLLRLIEQVKACGPSAVGKGMEVRP